MGWEDPSPRARGRSPAGRPATPPGDGDERVSLGRIVWRLLLAACLGALPARPSGRGMARARACRRSTWRPPSRSACSPRWRHGATRTGLPRTGSAPACATASAGAGAAGDCDDSGVVFSDTAGVVLGADAIGGAIEAVVEIAGDVIADL